MNVLILNWRDIRSSRAGGAEVLTHEIASRLVERGDQVTLFTSREPGAAAEDVIDGVRVVRRGSEVTTRFFAPRFERSQRWDVVVEEINTLPYFSQLWSRARTLLFIPQLAREVWWHEAPRPLAAFGYASERILLSAYRNTEAVTISASTVADLREIGLRAPIHVIPMASSTPALSAVPQKVPSGQLLIVGRLVSSKRVDHSIRALAHLRRNLPTARLTIVGDGPQRASLEALARELEVDDSIEFAGKVPEDEKARLLQDADVLVACGVREGWGLTVTEAARVGTPSVCYRVPGLRDSVVDGRTGLLTEANPTALAGGVRFLLEDPVRYQRFRVNAWTHNAELSWEQTASAFAHVLSRHRDGSRTA
jgi:glycosyltransferase involved in cell wall biosynthesis